MTTVHGDRFPVPGGSSIRLSSGSTIDELVRQSLGLSGRCEPFARQNPPAFQQHPVNPARISAGRECAHEKVVTGLTQGIERDKLFGLSFGGSDVTASEFSFHRVGKRMDAHRMQELTLTFHPRAALSREEPASRDFGRDPGFGKCFGPSFTEHEHVRAMQRSASPLEIDDRARR